MLPEDYRHPLIGEPGAPDFATPEGLAEWIERVRSIAFFGGARHGEISAAEARVLLRHIRTAEREAWNEAVGRAARMAENMEADTIAHHIRRLRKEDEHVRP